jgi:hypothetical protein
MESLDADVSKAAAAQAVNNFNNGMINTYSHEAVLRWNELLSRSIDNQLPQPAQAKIYAMVTLTIHDALNNVVPKYEPYALDNGNVDASDISHKNIHAIANAAVSQAARDMLTHLFPPATPAADELLQSMLGAIDESSLKSRGIDIGKAAAAAMLDKRKDDFPLVFTAHTGGTAPGEHQANFGPWMLANPPIWPANAVYSPNLGSLTPFGIRSGNQFRNEIPFLLATSNYIADYNEVKALGCTNCPARTDEQSVIGAFWLESTSSSMNRLARTLIAQKKLDGWEAARLIGLVQMSIIDAYIASFDGKYFFNFWRPITAIRGGDTDGIEATTGDISWTSTFTTPPTPEFPSTHAYSGGAAPAVFKAYFHTDHLNLQHTSPYILPGVERRLSSFSQITHEIAVSRIYIGFHFRHAVEVGAKQGRQLGNYVFDNNLRERKRIL